MTGWKIRWLPLAALAIGLFMGCPVAQAEPTVADVLAWELNPTLKQINDAYISGLIAGFLWYGAAMQLRGAAPVFCPPLNMAIRPEQGVSILQTFAQQHSNVLQEGAGMGLLEALILTFPCGR